MDELTSEPVSELIASTVTLLLAPQIREATETLPLAHLISPASSEAFEDCEVALRRL
jgi:hypothetical protein